MAAIGIIIPPLCLKGEAIFTSIRADIRPRTMFPDYELDNLVLSSFIYSSGSRLKLTTIYHLTISF